MMEPTETTMNIAASKPQLRCHEDVRTAVRALFAESLGRVSAAFADISDGELDDALMRAKSEVRNRSTRDG